MVYVREVVGMAEEKKAFKMEKTLTQPIKITITITISAAEAAEQRREQKAEKPADKYLRGLLPEPTDFIKLLKEQFGLEESKDYYLTVSGQYYMLELLRYIGRDVFSKIMQYFADFKPEYRSEDKRSYITLLRAAVKK